MGRKTEMMGFKTTPEIKEAITNIAIKEDRSVSYIINRILSDYLNSNTGVEGEEDNQG